MRVLLAACCSRMPDVNLQGVVARRTLELGLCEMKRLYVRPQFRGRGLARTLTEAVIADARGEGYRTMVLDTLASMQAARALYTSLGFRPVPTYYDNPLPDVVYLGLDLGLCGAEGSPRNP